MNLGVVGRWKGWFGVSGRVSLVRIKRRGWIIRSSQKTDRGHASLGLDDGNQQN
jgi:hypothetical protein